MNSGDRSRPDIRSTVDRGGMAAVPSYDTVFFEEYPKMVALAAAVGGHRAQAEDIAQEALARLNRDWNDVAGYDKVGAWLRRVTINLALSHRRRMTREARALLRLDQVQPHLDVEPPTIDRPVWNAVRSLPKQQRIAVAMHFLEDASVADIADVLDVAPATVRVHLHRARRTLRHRIEEINQ